MTNKISKEVIMKTQFKEYYSLEGSFLDFIVNFKRVALGSSIGHTIVVFSLKTVIVFPFFFLEWYIDGRNIHRVCHLPGMFKRVSKAILNVQ